MEAAITIVTIILVVVIVVIVTAVVVIIKKQNHLQDQNGILAFEVNAQHGK